MIRENLDLHSHPQFASLIMLFKLEQDLSIMDHVSSSSSPLGGNASGANLSLFKAHLDPLGMFSAIGLFARLQELSAVAARLQSVTGTPESSIVMLLSDRSLR